MVSSQPHYLLFSRSEVAADATGRWQFVLESIDGEVILEASDSEPSLRGERLELLAVVRGLEALDQPSRVTLVTTSRRISRGFRFGLDEWRQHDWHWERDGRWVPIKNGDLWRRVDRALKFHQVQCRTWRFDAPSLPACRPRMEASRGAPHSVGVALKTRFGAAVRAFFGDPHPLGLEPTAQLSN